MKRNGYTKYLSYYVDDTYVDNGAFPTPGFTMWYPFPWFYGKEPAKVNTYKSTTSYDDETHEGYSMRTETIAVFSFRRSRKWNIGRLTMLVCEGLLEKDFFDYHCKQLFRLFGNKVKYRTAMAEIEQRSGVDRGFCYREF